MWVTAPFIEKPFQIPSLPLTWAQGGRPNSGVLMFYYLLHEVISAPSLVTYLFPVGGVIFGVIFLNEHLSWQLLAGTLLIISSLAVVNWKTAEKMDFRQVAAKTK
jgi:drug/metabolite transporter (DMT)-like permease